MADIFKTLRAKWDEVSNAEGPPNANLPCVYCPDCDSPIDVPAAYIEAVRPMGGARRELWIWRDGIYSVNITEQQRRMAALKRKLAKHERKLAKRRAMRWQAGPIPSIDQLEAKAKEVARWRDPYKVRNRWELVAYRWHEPTMVALAEIEGSKLP